jgi:hypothetical protein
VRTKKKGKKSKTPPSQVETGGKAKSAGPDQKSWGVLEPVRGILKPVGNALQPLLGNVMYGLLVGLLGIWILSWFGYGFPPNRSKPALGNTEGIYRGDRLMAYEETWAREESALWEWLDERVGLDRLNADSPIGRKKAIEQRAVEERLTQGRMREREVEEAIRVTEEKLRILKEVMGKKADLGNVPTTSGGIPSNKGPRAEL